MAVNADWSGVRDWEQLHADDYEYALTEAFMTAGWWYGWFDVLGMSSITAENVGEVWARFATLQGLGIIRMTGMSADETILVTKEDIVRRIGLKSNYSTLTRAKWITTKLKVVMDARAKEVSESVSQ